MTLHSPYLVVPENGSYSKESHLLVVDLGKLTLKGSTKDPHSLEEVSLEVDFRYSFYWTVCPLLPNIWYH